MRQYLITHTDLVKLLDKFTEFKTTFDRFISLHNNYTCDADITLNSDNVWECKITIKDESNGFREFKKAVKTARVS